MTITNDHSNIFTLLEEEEIDNICKRILSFDPDDAEALRIAGVLACKRGQTASGIELVQKACRLREQNPYFRYDLALLLADQDKTLSVRMFAEAGTLFASQEKFDEAIVCWQTCLHSNPENKFLRIGLALLYFIKGRNEESRILLQSIPEQDPDNCITAFANACLCFPSVYRSEAEIDAVRDYYTQCLGIVSGIVDVLERHTPAANPVPVAFLGNLKPFRLAYQGYCDRDLQATFGRDFTRYVRLLLPERFQLQPHPKRRRIRVGFVSAFLRLHSVHKLFRGWMEHLDPERFAVFVYAVGPIQPGSDCEGLLAGVENFHFSPRSIPAWEERLIADQLDVLIYPEIGMGCNSLVLATRRLAPVQCAAWGHPETTGLPTIDYFLSSELMEPAGAQEHYTEQLILLPHLSIWYESPQFLPHGSGMNRSQLGLRKDSFVYACTQSTWKYLPRYDEVFPRIATHVPEVQFLFLEHPTSEQGTNIFKERLEASFAQFGLEAKRHCVFSPRLEPEAYLDMQHHVDAVLDSIGWSGGVSTLEALAYDLPVLTLPTGLMRGRHGAAFLRQMGLEYCIAPDLDAYVALAVSLAKDKAFYRQALNDVAASKKRLYRDEEAIIGLEAFLISVTRG